MKILEGTRAELVRTDDRLSFAARLARFYRGVRRLPRRTRRGRAGTDGRRIEPRPRARRTSRRHRPGRRHAIQLAASCRREPHRAPVVLARSRALLRVDDRRQGHPLARAARCFRDRGAGSSTSRGHSRSARRSTGPEGAGQRLRQMLVEPVLASSSPGAPVVIVPDGALHGLNFETLPAAGSPRRYWIEDVEIQIAPSLALLGRPRDPPPGAVAPGGRQSHAAESRLPRPSLRLRRDVRASSGTSAEQRRGRMRANRRRRASSAARGRSSSHWSTSPPMRPPTVRARSTPP